MLKLKKIVEIEKLIESKDPLRDEIMDELALLKYVRNDNEILHMWLSGSELSEGKMLIKLIFYSFPVE